MKQPVCQHRSYRAEIQKSRLHINNIFISFTKSVYIQTKLVLINDSICMHTMSTSMQKKVKQVKRRHAYLFVCKGQQCVKAYTVLLHNTMQRHSRFNWVHSRWLPSYLPGLSRPPYPGICSPNTSIIKDQLHKEPERFSKQTTTP